MWSQNWLKTKCHPFITVYEYVVKDATHKCKENIGEIINFSMSFQLNPGCQHAQQVAAERAAQRAKEAKVELSWEWWRWLLYTCTDYIYGCIYIDTIYI